MIFEPTKITNVKQQLVELTLSLRSKNELSQQQLADKIGVSRITIQNLEASKNVTLDTLLKVFHYFDLLEKLHLFLKDETDSSAIPSLY